MKYSVHAHYRGRPVAAGHLTARSALDDLTSLKDRGAKDIQIIDARNGRLIDEAGLARAAVDDDALQAKTRRVG